MNKLRSTLEVYPLLLAGAVAVLSGCTTMAPEWPNAEFRQQLESARTRTDHEAIAAIYEGQARKARSSAQEHRWQALNAQLHQLGTVDSASGRCAAIAKNLRTAAAEYDKLAADHRTLAEAAPVQASGR